MNDDDALFSSYSLSTNPQEDLDNYLKENDEDENSDAVIEESKPTKPSKPSKPNHIKIKPEMMQEIPVNNDKAKKVEKKPVSKKAEKSEKSEKSEKFSPQSRYTSKFPKEERRLPQPDIYQLNEQMKVLMDDVGKFDSDMEEMSERLERHEEALKALKKLEILEKQEEKPKPRLAARGTVAQYLAIDSIVHLEKCLKLVNGSETAKNELVNKQMPRVLDLLLDAIGKKKFDETMDSIKGKDDFNEVIKIIKKTIIESIKSIKRPVFNQKWKF